ncbi:DUF6301 family protein [Microbacterium murale]|uniref:CdiI immunity protein domain-containing protein n=1 Tax=Microbacterium murale TaxID=1081040 RepID=A0ABU0P462_9MICO|nr:DUF6301 family protein [Microbacterium murale]MDQ0642118.1 hypothetical protein [Microbacterium murale]
MVWKAMTPGEVCDLLAYFSDLPWPLSRAEVHRLAIEHFGWTAEIEDDEEFLVNSVSGLSDPDVATVASREWLSSLNLQVTDRIQDESAESAAFLGDVFTSVVREGAERWGGPAMERKKTQEVATWNMSSGGKASLTLLSRSVSVAFFTPQRVEADRKAGY